MRKFFTTPILMVLIVLMTLTAVSCKKKNVKKIEVDNQFAIALFDGTISLKDMLKDMDSTTAKWLRVRNDSLFAYYADTANNVLKASDLLGDIEDTDFTTVTDFSLPPINGETETDTTLFSENFTEIPFEYDGFDIEEVIIRGGVFSFNVVIDPILPMLKKIVIFSEQLVSQDNDPLMITIDYDKSNTVVDLSGYKIRPNQEKKVTFSSYITFHYDPSMGFTGGAYTCTLRGGITNMKFKTVYAIVTKPLDSVIDNSQPIDFGISGLSGSATIPIPRIALTYRNTFGLHADCDITKFEFTNNAGPFNLLAAEQVDVDVLPTNGEYYDFIVNGLSPQIDALAGWNRLDFTSNVSLALPGDHISISDTSSVDVIANVEMPLSFSIDDLNYLDTIKVSFGKDVNIQNYLDEIQFTIDYNNQIPVNVEMQGLFLKNNRVIDSLFAGGDTLLFNTPSQSIDCRITDSKLNNVMRATKMILRLRLTTRFDETQPAETVILKESDFLYLRMKMRTKTSEINIDDII